MSACSRSEAYLFRRFHVLGRLLLQLLLLLVVVAIVVAVVGGDAHVVGTTAVQYECPAMSQRNKSGARWRFGDGGRFFCGAGYEVLPPFCRNICTGEKRTVVQLLVVHCIAGGGRFAKKRCMVFAPTMNAVGL